MHSPSSPDIYAYMYMLLQCILYCAKLNHLIWWGKNRCNWSTLSETSTGSMLTTLGRKGRLGIKIKPRPDVHPIVPPPPHPTPLRRGPAAIRRSMRASLSSSQGDLTPTGVCVDPPLNCGNVLSPENVYERWESPGVLKAMLITAKAKIVLLTSVQPIEEDLLQ